MSTQTPPEPTAHGPITLTDLVRYQGASGDMNPLHHDSAVAQAAGFEGPFAPGMYPAGLLATWATDWLGPGQIRSYRMRFREQAWPGDVLTCSGEIVREYEEAGERRVDVELACTRQTGGVTVQGWASFVVV